MTTSSANTFFIASPLRVALSPDKFLRVRDVLLGALRIGLRRKLGEVEFHPRIEQVRPSSLDERVECHAVVGELAPAEAEARAGVVGHAALDALAGEARVVEDGLQLAGPVAVV